MLEARVYSLREGCYECLEVLSLSLYAHFGNHLGSQLQQKGHSVRLVKCQNSVQKVTGLL